MMSEKYDLQRDLEELQAMVASFRDYVQNDELYGSVGGGFFGGSNMPALTSGAILMRLRRLLGLSDQLNARQQDQLAERHAHFQQVRDEWRAHYEQHLKQEAHSRLKAMRTFFTECQESARACHNVYRPEMLRRTIVQEILREMAALRVVDPTLPPLVESTDGQLRALVRPTAFLWADVLRPIYTPEEFWWLYHMPPPPEQA